MINEHDMTKSMIDTMRSVKLVRESVEPNQAEQSMGMNNEQAPQEIIILKNGEEQNVEGSISGFWKSDKESFMQTVSYGVRFTSF
jgi:hypothetical protein